jgi:hypothetical protein
MTDYWKYVKPDPRGLEENPYINQPKMAVPDVSSRPAPASPAAVASIANTASDFITLEKIVCVDARGNVIEKHDKLQVRKDVERKPDGNHINFTPYNATVHFENSGLFLPSFALSCNILAALYANRNDAEIQKVLMQYKDHGVGRGWQAQNTLVNWGAKQVIHYPGKVDYTSAGGTTDINTQRTRKPLAFNNTGFSHMLLEEALRNKDYNEFMQNLTGLPNPRVLVEIGAYFGKPAKSWVSSDNKTRAAWLGCNDGNFDLSANFYLVDILAARGVSLAAGGGARQKRGDYND